LKQHPNELAAVQRAFNLTPGEVSRLHSSQVGEGLIIVGQDSAWFSAMNMTDPAEHRVFETSMNARRSYNEGDLAQLESGRPPELEQGSFLLPEDFPSEQQQLPPAPHALPPAPEDDAFGDSSGWGGEDSPSPFEPLQ